MAAIVDLIKLGKLISGGRQRVILPKQLQHQIYLKTHVWRTRNRLPGAVPEPSSQDLPQGPLWACSLSAGAGVRLTGESMLTGWAKDVHVQDSHQETSLSTTLATSAGQPLPLRLRQASRCAPGDGPGNLSAPLGRQLVVCAFKGPFNFLGVHICSEVSLGMTAGG